MAELERSGEVAGRMEETATNAQPGMMIPLSKDQLFNIRRSGRAGRLTLRDCHRRSIPVTTKSTWRLPHLEHASRSRQSGMVVSGTIALGHFDRVGLDLVAAMLAAGSLPDVIGDVHGLSINGPAFDQPVRLAEYFDSSGAGREIGTRFRSGACSRCVPHRDDLRLILFNNKEV